MRPCGINSNQTKSSSYDEEEGLEARGPKKGGVYRHFSSKEELAAEAFDYAWRAAFGARSSIAPRDGFMRCVRRWTPCSSGPPYKSKRLPRTDHERRQI